MPVLRKSVATFRYIRYGRYVPTVFDANLVAKLESHAKLAGMSDRIDFSYMANLYMALADQTRLKLLRQMYGGEVCVGDFTDALGDSQPKISRHLAYLRNAGIVNTRREGKWIHYSIRWPDEEGGQATLRAALDWLTGSGCETTASSDASGLSRAGDARYEYPIDIYADANINERETEEHDSDSAHNELEEFLL